MTKFGKYTQTEQKGIKLLFTHLNELPWLYNSELEDIEESG